MKISTRYPDLNMTTFPENKDSFTQFLDILSTDGALIKEYKDAVSSGNQTVAMQKLQQIPAYRRKLLTAEDLNKFADAVVALERFYGTDITSYVNTKQSQWQSILNQFTYKGNFSSSYIYQRNNYVTFGVGSDKNLYIALQDVPQGIVPTNPTYWRKFSVKGIPGEPGIGISFSGEWEANISYILDNCVQYDGSLWIALQSSTNQIPVDGGSYWKKITDIGQAGYPLSQNQPSDQKQNDLWFKIV